MDSQLFSGAVGDAGYPASAPPSYDTLPDLAGGWGFSAGGDCFSGGAQGWWAGLVCGVLSKACGWWLSYQQSYY